jgi:putative Holliday junction resolvase
MRAAAVDLGSVRVGLAVADELGLLAHPRPALRLEGEARLLDALSAFAQQEGIEAFVVGLPRSLSGREGPPARRARHFAEVLGKRTGLPVVLVDERLTTRQAQRHLHAGGHNIKGSRSRIDSAAAAVLLQGWLDARRPRDSEG